MPLTKEEITNLSLRYLSPEEIADFPIDNDLFYLLLRNIPVDRILKEEEGWSFGGYGICTGYTYDEEAKPRGKWLWMHYTSLASFPPVAQVLKLQPPHVAKGRFQSFDRTHEIRVIKIIFTNNQIPSPETDDHLLRQEHATKKQHLRQSVSRGNIVAFRPKGKV